MNGCGSILPRVMLRSLFSPDMSQVLWSNGEGAFLFGLPSIYDFIDSGANRNDAAYRQMEAAARQLKRSGDSPDISDAHRIRLPARLRWRLRRNDLGQAR